MTAPPLDLRAEAVLFGLALLMVPVVIIRSDRLLRIMGLKIELPEAFVHEYVTAVLDVHREELTVIHRGRRVKRVRFRL